MLDSVQHVIKNIIAKLAETNSVDVVTRLRLAMLAIIIILATVILTNGYQLLNLWNAQKHTTEQVIPSLIVTKQLQNQLVQYIAQSNQISRASTEEQISETHESVTFLYQAMNDNVLSAEGLIISRSLEENWLDKLPELAKTAEQLVAVQRELISLERSIEHSKERLAGLRVAISEEIEPQFIDAAIDLEQALNDIASSSVPMESGAGLLISKKTARQTNLSEMQIRVSNFLDLVDQISSQRDSDSAESIANLSFSMRSITQLLSTLEESENRRKLAKLIRLARSEIFEKNGLLENLSLLKEQRLLMQSSYEEQATLGRDVTEWVESVVVRARNETDRASQSYRQTLFKLIMFSVVGSVLLVSLLLFINHFVVERQINRRMSKLTLAMQRIASGSIDIEVEMEGRDEIGRMARTLDVFKDNAKELSRSNKELEQFAYAASHDLRSPLRAIENLAQWTLEDAADVLSTDCKDNLDKIIDRVQRLSKLQDDLLNFSKVSNKQNKVEEFQASEQIKILSDLLDPENNYQVADAGDVHPFNTYLVPLNQILFNLVDNAIKHHDRDNGKITIQFKQRADKVIIRVSDDGPGVDPKYQGKIFGMFESLHSKDKTEGSGLGLSLVQKLVSQNGGSVRFISDPKLNRGATVEFSWPILN
jgi:signal transduction histidine kinase